MSTFTLLQQSSLCTPSSSPSRDATMNFMNLRFGRSKKKASTAFNNSIHEPKSALPSFRTSPSTNPFETSRALPSTNPFEITPATAMPTRRAKAANNVPPPPYSASESSTTAPTPVRANGDSQYAFLTQFDTIFLIDDSGSMAGRSWRETSAALSAIAPVCTAHDADGLDIYFLNHRNTRSNSNLGGYANVTSTASVEAIFNSVRPLGGTPTGTRLHQILKPYLLEVENAIERQAHGSETTVKPLNIIVVTDGVPSDDVESVIVHAAKRLDACGAEPWQVGIQFFQVGREPEAAQELQELDDALSTTHRIRDMVDTVPWNGDDGQMLTAEKLLKICLGSVNRRLDRRTV